MFNTQITKLKKAVTNRWVLFNAIALGWFVLAIPSLFIFEQGMLFYGSLIVALVLAFLDGVKFDVAENKPMTFIRIEYIKDIFSKVYWAFIYIPSIVLWLTVIFLPNNYMEQIKSVFIPIFVGFGFVLIGATIYQAAMIGNIRKQPLLLKTRSEASFRILSRLLTSPSVKKNRRANVLFLKLFLSRKSESIEEKKKQIRLFEDGLNNLNRLFIHQFSFELHNPSRYSDYFRFILWTNNSSEINRIRKTIDVLAYNLRKKIEISDILWSIRQITGEKQVTSKDELFQDLDFKTGFNRWYSHNKEILKIILPVASLSVSVVAFLARFMDA